MNFKNYFEYKLKSDKRLFTK